MIEIKLINTSNVQADWIDVVAQDSLSDQMRKTLDDLQSSHLASYERYELEYELVHRPVLSVTWTDSIGPRGTGWIRLKCLGKTGCRFVGVKIEYDVNGGLNLKRQLGWSIGLSVQKSLNVVGFDSLAGGVVIIKVHNSAQGGQVFEVEAKGGYRFIRFSFSFQKIESFDIECGHFLFDLNVGGKTESQSFMKKCQKQVIQPGSTHAFFIEIQPIKVTQLDSQKTIPALIDRQFVVAQRDNGDDKPMANNGGDNGTDKNHNSKSKEKMAQAELLKFWIKERLLNTIKMEWREVGFLHTLPLIPLLRGVHVDHQMVNNLRSHEVSVQMNFHNDDLDHNDDVQLGNPGQPQALLQTDRFYSVLVNVKNQSGMKRKIDCLMKVMRLDGTVIPSENNISRGRKTNAGEEGDNSESPVYLIEGVVQDQYGPEVPHRPGHHLNHGGTRTVMLGSGEEDDEFGHDDHEQQIWMKICFLTRGAFVLQGVALDTFSDDDDDHPASSLGTSDPIHVVVVS
ncbi:hypothetical protein VP01_2524g3 [Puccinia sorghi]|uniref:Trs120/TRAPPC9 third Ig-like domain-containing protein n=1 Tax=Puccinia sorghi TaxID=27349 RepID=A0A0L6V7A8_9BASI|nr:hypothetical protein VP01_2524g3 [Puccinia sorghi]